MVSCSAKPTPLKLELAFDRDVGYYHGQHLLMNVNSCYSVRHRFLLVGGGERAASYFIQGRWLSPLPSGEDNAQLFAQSHAPDQTDRQPRLLHCFFDLAAPN